MKESFNTQPALFVSATALDPPSLHGLDDTGAVLDWSHLEALMNEIHASRTGRPSYPLLTLLRGLLLGIWYKLSDEQLAASLARARVLTGALRGTHKRASMSNRTAEANLNPPMATACIILARRI